MQNKINAFIFSLLLMTSNVFADTISVVSDSIVKPSPPPNQGPLGIDNTTGVALYGAAILFAVLVLLLWRSNIIKRRNTND